MENHQEPERYRGPNGPPSQKKLRGLWSVQSLENLPEKAPGTTRFVCVSDTHEEQNIMNGDVLLHAGDFSYTGEADPIKRFNDWLGSLPHPEKIVIAGNHDISFHFPFYHANWNKFQGVKENPYKIKASLTNCVYLEDSEYVTKSGIRVYGSPWQPEFCDWAFNLNRGQELIDKWALIPEGIDVLMTHGPPMGHGDKTNTGVLTGCADLLKRIQDIRPIVHVFGHIHEGYGITTDEKTHFLNACTVNLGYKPVNPPLVFDLENST